MFYPSLYPLLFFPAHGKILAWAGRKKYPGREGKMKKIYRRLISRKKTEKKNPKKKKNPKMTIKKMKTDIAG